MYKELDRDHYRLKPNYTTAVIDRVFLDFDGDDAFKEMVKVHNQLLRTGVCHHVNFSGNGYHIFVHTKVERLRYPKEALRRYAIGLTKNQDFSVSGDLGRLVRIPNTWHLGAERFCVNLTPELIEKGEEAIKEFASKPNPNFCVIGDKLISLKDFDFEEKVEDDFEYEDVGELVDDIPGCVQHAMTTNKPSYTQRQLYFMYMQELGYSMESALAMVKDVWTWRRRDRKTVYQHSTRIEHQPQTIWYNKLMFPRCSTIRGYGDCKRCKE